ncbi:hypothetical protein QVD17_07647 [Tagetes erecta]|uniref:AAA+ ATPase domain-containing protein n=1 Tax=Tagetes erecta TaxID=13708 RepID=A0AAD8LHT8_TARER|nr:hypothetical protein QVD17_07647 [Tagetes erecta]
MIMMYSTPPISDIQLVNGLNAKYPEYRRFKPELITRMLQDANKNKRKLSWSDDDDDDDDNSNIIKSESTSSSSDDDEEDKCAVLTSEDEVYRLQEFDLTKSMLRNRYRKIKTDKKVDFLMEDKTAKPMKEEKCNKISLCNGPMFKDIGGMDDVLVKLTKEVLFPLYHLQEVVSMGISPVAGILLHGPPGCGKSKLAHAIANESRFPFYKVSAPDLLSAGASEENIRELFTKAYRTSPSIVFIDEIDAIASQRENLQREMDRRIVTQLMTCMDDTLRYKDEKLGHVLVIGATNRPDVLDPALRRPGRFDCEISLGVPDENARLQILSVLTRNKKLEGAFDLVKIARSTPGFVGADLTDLVNKAGKVVMNRVVDGRLLEDAEQNNYWWKAESEESEYWWMKPLTSEEKSKLSFTMSDVEEAAKLVQPSLKRKGFSSVPDVKWEDVGGLDSLRTEFHKNIIRPIKYPDVYKEEGIKTETGFLLYGPPGCGKTLIAKAVANEAGANFIHIKGPEILTKYVGEAEEKVRRIFSDARTCSPCILFFDEIDSLTKKRGTEGGSGGDRIVNQLLLELDGGDRRKGVYVIGATNRPDVMDQTLLRPGRFGKLLYVPLPNQDERGLILKALSRNKRLDADVDLMAVARSEACENFSGADLSNLMMIVTNAAFEEKMSKIEAASREGTSSQKYIRGMPSVIKNVHFEQVLGNISPSVSEKVKQYYNRLSKRFGASNGCIY